MKTDFKRPRQPKNEDRKKLSPSLIEKLIEIYEEKHAVNVLKKRRDRHIVVPRQCLGLILSHKYKMTFQSVGKTLSVNHATIIHGNKQCKNFLTLGDDEYATAMLNWKLIFDEHHLDIEEEINTYTRVRRRIKDLLEDSIMYSGLKEKEAKKMLENLLKTEYKYV